MAMLKINRVNICLPYVQQTQQILLDYILKTKAEKRREKFRNEKRDFYMMTYLDS